MPDMDYLHRPGGIRLRHACWKTDTANHRGDLLLLGGRTEFIEKYDETARELTARGFDVYSFDWRGQGLSTRELSDPRKGYVRQYEDYVQDMAAFVENRMSAREDRRFSILAHSMGGHIAFRYLQQAHRPVERAVLVCSMMGIFSSPFVFRVMEGVSAAACNLGLAESYLPGQGKGKGPYSQFPDNPYTSDRQRFNRVLSMVQDAPALATGGATWAWLRASCRSVREIHRPGLAEGIRVPILFVGGGRDRVVSLDAQKEMAGRVTQGVFHRIQDARHEILMENDALRSAFWRCFDDFMGVWCTNGGRCR